MSSDFMPAKRKRILGRLFGSWLAATLTLMVIVAAVVAAPTVYYERSQGSACASCHEIWQPYNDWHSSSHRNVPCSDCHGDLLTFNAGFHLNNMRRVFTHLRGGTPEKPHLKNKDVLAMTARCQHCHQQEFASWHSSRHSATYADVFLNTAQNQKQMLMDDCLRCHAAHFQGSIRDLVVPINTKGPWRLVQPELADHPAVPCLACHQVHREGIPLANANTVASVPAPQQEIARPSLAFFDRREFDHVALADLPLPFMLEGARPVEMSPDQRQALCYQCHAALATRQVYSGDDRTPTGVHEGLSCFSCHLQHGEQTRASCDNCHLQHATCGIAVEKMDTTFKDKTSKHDIHSMKCVDCHESGVPKRKSALTVASVSR
jgi:nitrate/TMAO reductase-like tetraheme cytochrome c subunit